MELVSKFKAWKLSPSFTMASELADPDAVICIGVSYRECHGVISFIERNPLRFSPGQWLTRVQRDPEVLALIPKGKSALDAATMAELEFWKCRTRKQDAGPHAFGAALHHGFW